MVTPRARNCGVGVIGATDVRQDGADSNRCSTKRKGYLSQDSRSAEAFPYNASMRAFFRELQNRALDLLENSVISRTWIENDPDLDALRDHPRFAAILASLPE